MGGGALRGGRRRGRGVSSPWLGGRCVAVCRRVSRCVAVVSRSHAALGRCWHFSRASIAGRPGGWAGGDPSFLSALPLAGRTAARRRLRDSTPCSPGRVQTSPLPASSLPAAHQLPTSCPPAPTSSSPAPPRSLPCRCCDASRRSPDGCCQCACACACACARRAPAKAHPLRHQPRRALREAPQNQLGLSDLPPQEDALLRRAPRLRHMRPEQARVRRLRRRQRACTRRAPRLDRRTRNRNLYP